MPLKVKLLLLNWNRLNFKPQQMLIADMRQVNYMNSIEIFDIQNDTSLPVSEVLISLIIIY